VALEQFRPINPFMAPRAAVMSLQDVGAILVGFQSALDGGDLAFEFA